jgi:hypothetical protein
MPICTDNGHTERAVLSCGSGDLQESPENNHSLLA